MKKKLLLTLATSAGIIFGSSLAINSLPVQAATVQTPINGTSYIQKGNTYKLHLKVPGRVTITTQAKYTLVNTSSWKCYAYPGKDSNTKEFYLRAGNYKLTTTSNSSKIKTNFTKLTKIKHTIDDFPISRKSNTNINPDVIKLGQTVKGFTDLYKTYPYTNYHYYKFTLDKPQKVTLDVSTMPIYNVKKQMSHTYISFSSEKNDFDIKNLDVKYKVENKKYTKYLPKGTYVIGFYILRGRYQFKLTGEDSTVFPSDTKITNITSTADGLKLEHTKSENAIGYNVYAEPTSGSYATYGKFSSGNGTSITIPKNELLNGSTYKFSLRPVTKLNDNYIYGNRSDNVKFTYYALSSNNDKTLLAPRLSLSYYDDNGSDEPYISAKWNENSTIDSYELAYRIKGKSDWHTILTNNKTGIEFGGSNNQNDDLYFVKGRTYEVKVRGLQGNLRSPWSDTKTITVTVTQA